MEDVAFITCIGLEVQEAFHCFQIKKRDDGWA